jgi:hypothetical protein
VVQILTALEAGNLGSGRIINKAFEKVNIPKVYLALFSNRVQETTSTVINPA